MDTAISFFNKYTILDLFAMIALLIAFVRGIEKVGKWGSEKLSNYYKRKKGIEKKDDTLASHTQQIKELTEKIDLFVDSVNSNCCSLVAKIDEQQKHLERIDAEGKKRDCAVFRDRILSGMRYFGQNKDAEGNVHISIGDHENMRTLFDEYFKAGGNGTIKQIYDTEFVNFKIDR